MVAASQSVVPHAQFAGLAAVPSVVAQAPTELPELNEELQKSPVLKLVPTEAQDKVGTVMNIIEAIAKESPPPDL